MAGGGRWRRARNQIDGPALEDAVTKPEAAW